MKVHQIENMLGLLSSFLGDSLDKDRDYNVNEPDSLQFRFNCPHCAEENGGTPDNKYNLEISLSKNIFSCWRCSSESNEMQGVLPKLFQRYGNNTLLKDYYSEVKSLNDEKLYSLDFYDKMIALSGNSETKLDYLSLPSDYHYIRNNEFSKKPLEYLLKRNITIDIIDKFKIGYTGFNPEHEKVSNRIILPSYDLNGKLNYWTGRDFTESKGREKYFNPSVDRMNIVFNEHLIQWDADITLVEGPFDSLVYPNMIPLLGKKIKEDFLVYKMLMEKANANINIFLDGDAYRDAKNLYKLLNTGRLYNKIRLIPVTKDLDPSLIYQEFGKNGIIEHLKQAVKIKEVYLF